MVDMNATETTVVESSSVYATTTVFESESSGDNLAWSVLQTTIISLVSILIILSNVTNIAVISRSLNDFGITGYFLISLAFADLGQLHLSVFIAINCTE